MRKLDLLLTAVFGIMAVAMFAAGFKNHSHFLFAALSAILSALAYVDYKKEKKNDERVRGV